MRITLKSGGKSEKKSISTQKYHFLKARSFALTLFVLGGDQLSKNWIVRQFEPGESWPLLKGIFHLTYVRNPGAAFGILTPGSSFLIIISLLMIILIFYGERFFPKNSFSFRLAMSVLLGGAIGNLIDRVRYGYVIDFIDFIIWPVFNVADIALVVGVIFLVYGLYKNQYLSFK